MKYKIGIWGQYSNGRVIADGQAVRTTIIANELINRYGSNAIRIIDTENWQKNPLFFLFNTIKLFFDCEKIIIAPADNGYKIVVPLYRILSFFARRELYDIVIGGYLPGLLKGKKFYLKCMNKYKALFVQTPNLKKDLEVIGLKNVFISSNLKRLNTVKLETLKVNTSQKLSVCTLSRINESKGIDDAVEAVRLANQKLGGQFINLDIYGIVADEYKEHFNRLLMTNREFVKYGGVLKYNLTVETLKNYFALLFPTFYYGEGFPGNIIDSFHSGLPIIATDWNYNKEVIKDGENGILVPIKDPDALCEALLKLYYDRNYAYTLAVNNLKMAEEYQPEKVLADLYSFLDK